MRMKQTWMTTGYWSSASGELLGAGSCAGWLAGWLALHPWYTGVAPACAGWCLRAESGCGAADPDGEVALLQTILPSPTPPLLRSVLFVARGGGWSPATHHHWPEHFRAMARAFLLTAHATAASRGAVHGAVTRSHARRRPLAVAPDAAATGGMTTPASSCLGDLPPAVLLHILRLAATPLSSWLSALHSWD